MKRIWIRVAKIKRIHTLQNTLRYNSIFYFYFWWQESTPDSGFKTKLVSNQLDELVKKVLALRPDLPEHIRQLGNWVVGKSLARSWSYNVIISMFLERSSSINHSVFMSVCMSVCLSHFFLKTLYYTSYTFYQLFYLY